MLKQVKEIVMICDKCNKTMPVDTEQSNTNWTAYKNVCSCGGKGKIKIM